MEVFIFPNHMRKKIECRKLEVGSSDAVLYNMYKACGRHCHELSTDTSKDKKIIRKCFTEHLNCFRGLRDQNGISLLLISCCSYVPLSH